METATAVKMTACQKLAGFLAAVAFVWRHCVGACAHAPGHRTRRVRGSP